MAAMFFQTPCLEREGVGTLKNCVEKVLCTFLRILVVFLKAKEVFWSCVTIDCSAKVETLIQNLCDHFHRNS